jgi:hypothetical protein
VLFAHIRHKQTNSFSAVFPQQLGQNIFCFPVKNLCFVMNGRCTCKLYRGLPIFIPSHFIVIRNILALTSSTISKLYSPAWMISLQYITTVQSFPLTTSSVQRLLSFQVHNTIPLQNVRPTPKSCAPFCRFRVYYPQA